MAHGAPDHASSRALPTRIILAIAAYVLLTTIGIVRGMPTYSVLAVLVSATTITWPALRQHAAARWIAILVATLAVASILLSCADALLDALPVVINAAIAGMFGRTLRHGREPLITRFVRVAEGESRASDPRIAGYTRALTRVWAVVLATQALVLGAAWWSGHIAGTTAPTLLPWLHAYARVGCHVVVGLLLVLEYVWRRWHLRHLEHIGFTTFVRRLLQHWPELLHERHV